MSSKRKHSHSIDALVHRSPWPILVVIASAFAIFIVLLILAPPPPAKAQSCPCGSYLVKVYRDWPEFNRVERRCYRCARATRVYGYSRREEDDERWERRDPSNERGVQCKDELVRVVGGLHLTKEGALNDAVRQWQSTVRYDHGERFMDIEAARGYVWRCDRAGTNETLAGRVGEALSGGNSFQRRCVVIGRPCRMPVIRGDKDER